MNNKDASKYYYKCIQAKLIKEDAEKYKETIEELAEWGKNIKAEAARLKSEREELEQGKEDDSQNEYGEQKNEEKQPAAGSDLPGPSRDYSKDKQSKRIKSPVISGDDKKDRQSKKINVCAEIDDMRTLHQKALNLKELGNQLYNNKRIPEALDFYTQAIKQFSYDPYFYANRAQCHLDMKNYENCIRDCDQALNIEPELTKAYYRRMKSFNALSRYRNALEDCKMILKLEPLNNDAIREKDRIIKQLHDSIDKEVSLATVSMRSDSSLLEQRVKSWTLQHRKSTDYSFVMKKESFRSKSPTKKVIVNESSRIENMKEDESGHIMSVNTSNLKHEEPKLSEVSAPLASQEISISSDEIQDISLDTENPSTTNEIILELPNGPSDFKKTWTELEKNRKERVKYLKLLISEPVAKLIGACFRSIDLTDILSILSDEFIKENWSVIEILSEISKHPEMKVLKVFMSDEDKDRVVSLIVYMKERNNDPKTIAMIRETLIYYE